MSFELRGAVEEMIDYAIKGTPELVASYRQPEAKKLFRITQERDFIFGMIMGVIGGKFSSLMALKYKREPTDSEWMELRNIVLRRAPEIESAIFSVG